MAEKNMPKEEEHKPKIRKNTDENGSVVSTKSLSEDKALDMIQEVVDHYAIDGIGEAAIDQILPMIRAQYLFFKDKELCLKLTMPVGNVENVKISPMSRRSLEEHDLDVIKISRFGAEPEQIPALVCATTGLSEDDEKDLLTIDEMRIFLVARIFFL